MGCALAYDPDSNKLILFGGVAGDEYDNFFNDTWSFDIASRTWTNLQPSGSPSVRAGHCMVYDPATRRVIMFGGSGMGSTLNDTWAYDPAANSWTNLRPSGELPSPRDSGSMVYDKAAGKMILFGGLGDGYTYDDQTWAFDPVADKWQNLHPAKSPEGRVGHSMAYDEAAAETILFGGMRLTDDTLDVFGDTWVYNSAINSWTNASSVAGSPNVRGGHAMVYDPVSSKTILFGGSFVVIYLGDTWSLGR